MFERIVCGVAETPHDDHEAVRQAARLLEPGGALHLFCGVYLPGAIAAGWDDGHVSDELDAVAGDAMRRALEIAGAGASARLASGSPVDLLLAEVARERATLVAIGTRGGSRLVGALVGGFVATMLERAPCSVLLARPPEVAAGFPRTIAVGLDGSPAAERAETVAARLRERFDASLATVALAHDPVSALVDASREADLLIVGADGAHGPRVRGSVSGRVAHHAHGSVLVVR